MTASGWSRLACHARRAIGPALRQPPPEAWDAEQAADERPGRQEQHVGTRARPEVERDVAAGADDAHRLTGELERVVDLAVLERDVAEREVGDVGRHVERSPVGDLDRAEPVDLAEPGDGLAAAFEEAGVEVAGVHRRELAGERARHAADPAADLDDGALVGAVRAQPEHVEVREHLVVAGRDELVDGELRAGLVVEHPSGLPDDLVGARVLLARRAPLSSRGSAGGGGPSRDCARRPADSTLARSRRWTAVGRRPSTGVREAAPSRPVRCRARTRCGGRGRRVRGRVSRRRPRSGSSTSRSSRC